MLEEPKSLNFLEEIIEADLAAHKNNGVVHTRFPPEPNGYLHIGHAKSICLNFGLSLKYGGTTNLRFDDTNPVTEETEYVNSIREDVKWLGFEWTGGEYYASDYFEQLYQYALLLTQKGLAYIDFSTPEEIAEQKGTPTHPGSSNAYRETATAENVALLEQMRAGKFADGVCVLRAKIDMASPNMQLRDPVIYRIKHAHHHRTGDAWCIYPMYDWAHGLSDAIEGITHSICTLEFVPHRPLYDWVLDQLPDFAPRPHQYEFARGNLSYTVVSKRKLKQLVEEGHVSGWDDPRMPTVAAFRRRGYTPSSIRDFWQRVGIAKRDNVIDVALLEFCIREELNKTATRAQVVLDPVKVIITNYAPEKTEALPAENNPENEADGTHTLHFGREIYIERDDFMLDPPKKYFRLSVGNMVRLKHAYIIVCDAAIKDDNGNITELHCRYIENSKSGSDESGINVKGTIHWVAAAQAIPVEVRLYDRLFTVEDPAAEADFKSVINPASLQVIPNALAEPFLAQAAVGTAFQFMRKGYFAVDKDSTPEKMVFNQTVGLKDSWAKQQLK